MIQLREVTFVHDEDSSITRRILTMPGVLLMDGRDGDDGPMDPFTISGLTAEQAIGVEELVGRVLLNLSFSANDPLVVEAAPA